MRISGLAGVMVLVGAVLLSGCISQEQYNSVKAQNRIQQQQIVDLESALSDAKIQLEQCQTQLVSLEDRVGKEGGLKDEEIAALERDIAAKKALIAQMQMRLLQSGVALPPELSMKLQDFAEGNDMVVFDANTGVLKFKSDVLFKPGSAKVETGAVSAIKSFCSIMNSSEAKAFDIIVAGHTDDQPIRASKARHPTNWHLSAHRAIGVLLTMEQNGIASKRLSARGLSEYRPVAENKPDKKGNPLNRRVELYIVPSGT